MTIYFPFFYLLFVSRLMPHASAQLLFYFNYILCLRGSGGVMVYSNVFHDITLICRTEKNAVRNLRIGSTLSTIKVFNVYLPF